MANRYHVGADGKVSECKARFRACPFDDYKTREGAATAYELKAEKLELDDRREAVNSHFKNKDLLRSTALLNASGEERGKRFRDYGHNLENSYLMNGKDPEAYIVNVALKQENVADVVKARVSAFRHELPNYNEGKIDNIWRLKIEYRMNTKEPVTLEVNFDNPAQDMRQVRIFLEESVRENQVPAYSTIEKETDALFRQFRKTYAMIEEEAQGPYYVWDKHGIDEGLGAFANSTSMDVIAGVEYNDSTFRARTVERFLEENDMYEVGTPNINFRVADNDAKNGNAWATEYDNGEWMLHFLGNDDEDMRTVTVKSPEEAEKLLYDFVRNNMSENDDWTAKEKAEYVATFMLQMESVQKKAEERGAKFRKLLEESGENKNRIKDELFGINKKESTIGSILSMFT